MNRFFLLPLSFFFVVVCCKETATKKIYNDFSTHSQEISSPLDSIFRYFSNVTPPEQAVFVIIKYIDASTTKIYFVSKKPQRSDFEFIGAPSIVYKKGDVKFFVYTGIERLLEKNNNFFTNNTFILDDSDAQKTGMIEFPITSKREYQIKDSIITELTEFDDMIFIPNPTRDTIKLK